MKKIALSFIASLGLFFWPLRSALAQTDVPTPPTLHIVTNAKLDAAIYNLILQVISILLGIAGALAAVYVVWSGIQYIQGGKGVESAKQGITNAIIGLIIIILSYVIIHTVQVAITKSTFVGPVAP